MSGDLKNPSRSIPSGTLGAVGFTYIAYAVMAVLMAGSLDRSTLKIDLSVMQDVAYIPSLVTIGILATSLFCTLGSIIGAAKILQAIAKDQLVKSLNRFSYGRVSDDGPTPAILLTWLIMQVLVAAVKDIDEMASYATMFSLLTFGVMNLACFLLRITGAVNFRPSFHYFTWQTASAGMIMCFVCMFYVDQLSASLSTLIMAAIFVLIHYKAPPKSWGDVMQSLIYHQVRKYLLRLDSRKDHVKFWRPQILILIDSPQENYLLIKFMNDLKKGGLYVLGHVLKGDFTHKIKEYKRQMPGWLRFVDIGRIKAFVELTIAKNERIGAQNLMLGGGLGGMKPNIVVMGFFDVSKQKASYDSEDDEGVETTSRARHRHQFTSSSSSSSTSCSGFDGDDNGNGARISTSTWARSAQPQAAPLTSPPHLNPQYRLRNPFTKRKISGIMEADTAAVLQKVSRDPLCSDLPRPSDVEKGISVENYVGIIEDALNLNKAVAISRNFEILDQKPSSTYSTCTSDGGNSRRSSAVRRWTTLVREEYRR